MLSELDVFGSLFEDGPVAYFELDADGIVVRANHAAGLLLGHDAAKIAGHSIWDFAVPGQLNEITSAKPFTQECLRRDGSTVAVEFHPNQIHDQNDASSAHG